MNKIKPFDPVAHITSGNESAPRIPDDGYFEITGDKKIDIANLKRFMDHRVVMIGEAHDDDYCKWFIQMAIDLCRPDYFLTEHTQYLNVQPGEFEKRLKTLKHDGLPYNKYTEYWLTVGRLYNIPFIGMDYLPPDGKLRTFEKVVYEGKLETSFTPREARMVEVLEEYYSKGRILLQVGDTHLRSSPEFFEGDGSPLLKFAQEHSEYVVVFRLKKIYQEMP